MISNGVRPLSATAQERAGLAFHAENVMAVAKCCIDGSAAISVTELAMVDGTHAKLAEATGEGGITTTQTRNHVVPPVEAVESGAVEKPCPSGSRG